MADFQERQIFLDLQRKAVKYLYHISFWTGVLWQEMGYLIYVLLTYYLWNNLLISSTHCELCTLKHYNTIFRLFLSEQQPASPLYLKLCAICTKPAASHYKVFANVSLTLILVHFGDDICIFGLWWFWLSSVKLTCIMCVKLTLLLILQGELYWMCLENLKVLHDLSIFGY